MKYEIEIEGLPEGWKAVAFRKPLAGENYIEASGNMDIGLATFPVQPRLIVERIHPRRIVLEETAEVRKLTYMDFYTDKDGSLCRWMCSGESGEEYKIWRRVKEN